MDLIPQPPTPWDVSPDEFPGDGSAGDKLRFLITYALLAPSTRNTQPWKFAVRDDEVSIHLDLSRRQKVADADEREMYISVGCALENLLIAAAHFGYRTSVEHVPDPAESAPVVRVRCLADGTEQAGGRAADFDLITRRHTNHGPYDGTPVSQEDLDALRAVSTEQDLRVDWFTETAAQAAIDDLVMRADALLLSDPEYRRELGDLIGAGVFGTPWLIALLGRFAVSHLKSVESFAKADHKALMSSPVLGVIGAHSVTREAQVRTGQVLERLYLSATRRGLSLQPVSQILQTPETAEALAGMLPPPAMVPLQPFRLGHARAPHGHTPRRALDEVWL